MQNYTGIRKEMKEAGWNRRDRHNEELWQRPGSEFLYTFDSAVHRYQKDKKKVPMNYQGWEITSNERRPVTGVWEATRHGVVLSAHSQASVERLVDRRIREEKRTESTKLKHGDLIEVHGYVFLDGLADLDRFRLKSIKERNGQLTYQFTKPQGRKIVISHYAQNVDAWIEEKSSEDLNKIVVIREVPIWNKGC